MPKTHIISPADAFKKTQKKTIKIAILRFFIGSVCAYRGQWSLLSYGVKDISGVFELVDGQCMKWLSIFLPPWNEKICSVCDSCFCYYEFLVRLIPY